MRNRLKSLPLSLLINAFSFIGYEITLSKITKNTGTNISGKYFNDGKSAYEQNTSQINDCFYADKTVTKAYYQGIRIEFYEELVKLVNSAGFTLNNKVILDIGCGSGHLLKYVCNSFHPRSISGYDFSKEAVNYAKNLLPEGKFFVFDVYNKPNNKYDFVFCTEVLEHLEYPSKALSRIMETVSKKGTCLLTVPNGRKDILEEHINFWSPESWKVFLLGECGGKQFKVTTGTIKGNNYAFITKT